MYFVGFDFYSTRKSLLVGLMRAYSVKLGLFFAVFAANEFERRKVTAEFEYFDVVFVRRICFFFFFAPASHSRFTFERNKGTT